MSQSLKISIVTVAYNAAGTIADTIESVLSQDYPNVEHIIIDGASADGTVEVIDRYRGRLARVVSEPDRGLYDAMNKGFLLATGDVAAVLNADDVYEDAEVLATVAEVMREPTVDACYGDLVYVDPHKSERIVRYWKSREYEPGLCLRGWMPAHPTFFARTHLYCRVGGFDLAFRRQADFEMAVRLFEVLKIQTTYIPKVLVRMRAGGISNNSVLGMLKGNLEAYRACRKNGFAVTPFFMARKMLSRVPQFFQRPA
jgi:glycosyltransferase involved in cell wall biosynthesis